MTSINDELQPCPLCGGAISVRTSRDWHRLVGEHAEDCLMRDFEPFYAATPEDRKALVSAWNRLAALVRTAPQGEPVAWMRKDGMKAMPADEKDAWREAAQSGDGLASDIVDEYTIPLYTYPASTGEAKPRSDHAAAFDAANLRAWYEAYPRMNIYTKPGDRVMFDGRGGYDVEIESAKKVLKMRGVYEVERTNVGSSSSSVRLKGVNRWFNTVMFAAPPEFGGTTPTGEDAREVLRQALPDLQELADTAERCDSWQSFPSEPLEKARAAITRIRSFLSSAAPTQEDK